MPHWQLNLACTVGFRAGTLANRLFLKEGFFLKEPYEEIGPHLVTVQAFSYFLS